MGTAALGTRQMRRNWAGVNGPGCSSDFSRIKRNSFARIELIGLGRSAERKQFRRYVEQRVVRVSASPHFFVRAGGKQLPP
jgi:hypothetical protein